jgi:hypothetical protein
MRRFAALLVLTLACNQHSTERELARLEKLQSALEKQSPPKQLVDVNRRSLAYARSAKTPEEKLYRLRGPFVNIETLAFLQAHKNESFEKVWKSRNAPRAIQAAENTALLQRALVEASSNQAEKLFHASLPYGKAAGAESGLFYLANAEANAKFAQFVRSLPMETPQPSPTEFELRGALAELEAEALQKFENKPSAGVKEARELLDRGSLAGATLALLETHRDLGHSTDPSQMKLWSRVANREQTRADADAVKVTLLRWPYT